MSVFLGKDNSLSPIIHITGNPQSISTLKTGPIVDTVFHSSLPYMHVLGKHDLTYVGTIYGGTNKSFRLDDAVISYIDAGKYSYMIVFNDSDICNSTQNLQYYGRGNPVADNFWLSDTYNNFSFTPTLTHRNFTTNILSTTKVTLVITSISNGEHVEPSFTNADIRVSAGSLELGGINIAEFIWLAYSGVNALDPSVNISPTDKLQLVNYSNTASSSSSLLLNSTSSTIYVNGLPQFSSSTQFATKKSSAVYLSPLMQYSGTYTVSIPTSFKYIYGCRYTDPRTSGWGTVISANDNTYTTLELFFMSPDGGQTAILSHNVYIKCFNGLISILIDTRTDYDYSIPKVQFAFIGIE